MTPTRFFHPARYSTRAVALLALLCAWTVPAFAQEAPAAGENPAAAPGATPDSTSGDGGDAPLIVEITPELDATVAKGLSYLASIQAEDGSWGGQQWGRHAGISALCCLAFMADGNLPGRGMYGNNVERGLNFILSCAQENGLIAADTSHGPMYGHGFATLFLGEVYGMTPDPRVREALVKAVRLIVTTQNREGGWRYHPIPFDADISVTICQVMALRSARNAGVSVPKETIDRAIQYVRQCQNPSDGGFRYMLNAGGSAFPRSAAGVASLYYAGVYEDQALNRGLTYLINNRDEITGNAGGHYEYGHYYAVQAMFLAGGRYWATWYPAIRKELMLRQQPDGSWASNHGEAFGSAMSLLILQIPHRFLPIFQR
ncbi:MAG: prenyltransferase [Phycisphaera sp.]|nr:prenyltransferase [Phycisphaera sp.]